MLDLDAWVCRLFVLFCLGRLILGVGLVDLRFGGCGSGYFAIVCCLAGCMWLFFVIGCCVCYGLFGIIVYLFGLLVCVAFACCVLYGLGVRLVGGFGFGCLGCVALLPGCGYLCYVGLGFVNLLAVVCVLFLMVVSLVGCGACCVCG